MKMCTEKEKAGLGNIQMYGVRRKGAPGSVMEPSPVLMQTKSLKKYPMLNGMKRILT